MFIFIFIHAFNVAWKFFNFTFHFRRIKMCTDITHKDFITVHHELAHIQYFMNYKHNPKVFRDGANPGNFLSSLLSRRTIQTLTFIHYNVLAVDDS